MSSCLKDRLTEVVSAEGSVVLTDDRGPGFGPGFLPLLFITGGSASFSVFVVVT
jgi:hypothetical protein